MTYNINSALDKKVLHELYGDDYEYMMQMFEIYLGMITDELAKLKEAMKVKDRDRVRQVAHKIKPVFLMVGLPKLNVLATEIEGGHKKGTFDLLNKLFKKLETGITETKPIFIEEIEKLRNI